MGLKDLIGGFFKPAAPHMSAAEADAARRAGDIVLIDVREPAEHAGGVPEGARRAPLGRPDFIGAVLAEVEGDRSRAVALICRTSMRSSGAARMLAKSGFDNLTVVSGGYMAWSREGLPVERG